ncbi:hypothetical protein QQ045_016349 [Rhodiola kirilowii]
MENFRQALQDCNLFDLGFSGYFFTFSNRRMGEAEVKVRLDRVVATVDWRSLFPQAVVSHHHLNASDHQLLVLDTEKRMVMRRKKLFRFETMWFDHPDFPQIMDEFWEGIGQRAMKWSSKLSCCKDKLTKWNKVSFGNVQRRIKQLHEELEAVKNSVRSGEILAKEKSITEELDHWLAREESLWLQRSRVLWMKNGDRNTKFFHDKASHRRKKNWMDKIKDAQGVIHVEAEGILRVVTFYFNNIFQPTVNDEAGNFAEKLRNIKPCIIDEMNAWLLRDITELEVRDAVFALGSLKAPGIDGFPAIFYQKYWQRLKNSVVQEVRKFWFEGVLDRELNRTLIVLIPKKTDATKMEECRPISLCTVAMKIITKILATRLQPLLDKVISPFQSAFVKGRLITDNFVVAHEVAHFLKRCKNSKECFASVKIDMSKAYDRVEWVCLANVLTKLGFTDKWVDRVMMCVTTVSYQVKVNDSLSSRIFPGRGLRQFFPGRGLIQFIEQNPLSPYLFLFCTELLTAELSYGVERKLLSDDSIFYLKANVAEASNLKSIFIQYETVSGQKINFEKSEISFISNTPTSIREAVVEVLGVQQVSNHSRYLGFPLIVGQRKTEVCRGIVEKIWKKVRDWKCNLLSAAGREVLIKAVAQAIPLYMMSVCHAYEDWVENGPASSVVDVQTVSC